MNHEDHVNLLRGGVPTPGGIWADFGAGRGAFTLALAELLGPGSEIYAVDKESRALRQLRTALQRDAPDITVHTINRDLRQNLPVPMLDGIVMANSLHFFADKRPVVEQMRQYLKPAGRLLLVEYNTDRGNHWVPYPLSFQSWQALAEKCGFHQTLLVATRPSSFLGEFYAAASW